MPDDRFLSRTALRHAIGDAYLARFHRTLERIGCWRSRFGVAVSGGPDSTALLLLCAAYEWPDSLFVATVDHGLRAGSAGEAAQVADLCGRLGVAHDTLHVEVATTRGGLQAAARESRYATLARWCPGGWLLTAHHRDDVAEAMLMRLARGSGVRGLARMAETAPLRPGGPTLTRPLLDWSKAELLDICARAGVATIRDPSNADPRFDRTAARTLLARTPWLDPVQVARSAANLAEADGALQWLADQCWTVRAQEVGDAIVLDPRGLPHDTKRRLVERIMTVFEGHDPDRRVEAMVRRLDAGGPAMLGNVMAIASDGWTFRRAPPRRGNDRSS